MKTIRLSLLITMLVLPACSKDPNVQELKRAARVIEQLVAPFYASRTSFFVVLPNGTPRQFVSWFFSPMGVADWPPTDEPSELSQEEIDAARQTGMALRPKDVQYRHSSPDMSAGKQIVLKWDDADGTVVLEGYVDPGQPPVYTTSFKLPKNVVPDQLARLTTQSNLELGMAYQSF
jgi:hypothetical protein